MNIKKRAGLILFFLTAVISLTCWHKFSYPQLAFLNLSVEQKEALSIARNYLSNIGYNTDDYHHTTIFQTDRAANRYLQKTIGFEKLQEFAEKEDFDLFYWMVRFFKENEKEEFKVTISPRTGEVIGLRHILESGEARETIEREAAKAQAIAFLEEKFNFQKDNYFIKQDLLKKRDYRSDYSFSWQKKDVHIPWSDDPNSGIGKIVSGVTISGDEVLGFSKNYFKAPQQFKRYIERHKSIGDNLTAIVRIFYYIILMTSIYFVIARKNHLAMHLTKRFYLGIIAFAFLLSIASYFNQYPDILFEYKTSSNLGDYLLRSGINSITSLFFISILMLMPALSGELLRFEVFKKKSTLSFLHYIRTSFFSKSVAESIGIGYLVFLIMLGIQSLIIKIGQTYWGVWIEHTWMNRMTSAYLPIIAALTIAFKASFTEELMFRMFGLSWGKKFFKNTFIAVIVMSVIWGFSHSQYPVFPMWFRGIEVTCLGLFLSFAYFRYGIISVIVGHFLFNIFWNTAEYLFGQTHNFYFLAAVILLLLPLGWALAALALNRKIDPKPLRWHLNKHQLYNLEVLKTYININRGKFSDRTQEDVKDEIASHGWDTAVVETALEDINKTQSHGGEEA